MKGLLLVLLVLITPSFGDRDDRACFEIYGKENCGYFHASIDLANNLVSREIIHAESHPCNSTHWYNSILPSLQSVFGVSHRTSPFIFISGCGHESEGRFVGGYIEFSRMFRK